MKNYTIRCLKTLSCLPRYPGAHHHPGNPPAVTGRGLCGESPNPPAGPGVPVRLLSHRFGKPGAQPGLVLGRQGHAVFHPPPWTPIPR